ncbi:hypothetical protein BST13_04820 [Mycobacterium aquaticum]|uniref:Uncharacterized protein n=1 Tax=Mycobacterium aquaticum TaxID=1927124 RepID=A0A1X0BA42_9MYCO|nr:hypothetical protein BST13_04820 [Mycobacterium aquaticum]
MGEVRSERPNGAPLPFIVVRRIGGGDDGLTDKGLFSVHTYAATRAGALSHARSVDRRLKLLAPPFGGQTAVNGDYVDNVVCTEEPVETAFTDDRSIFRFTGTYRVETRL